MRNRFLQGAATLALIVLSHIVNAEDIDLFAGTNTTNVSKPNVLLVIDNAANFSASASHTCTIDGVTTVLSGTAGGIEQCALHTVISGLAADSVNIAIMVYNGPNIVDYQGTACITTSSDPGGCLVYPMQLMTSANKTTLLNWIKTWKTSGSGAGYIKASSKATGGSMQEAWAYYAGRKGLSTRDYSSIQPTGVCQKNFTIYIGNNFNSSGSPSDQTGNKGPKDALDGTNSTSLMNASPAATTAQKTILNSTITTSCGSATLGTPHENKGYYADEWARYMKAQNITTYTIGLLGASCQADYAALLTSMATVGGGKYFPTDDYNELKVALETVFSEILSVNSVFASVSLPVSVNTEGTYLNQVYVGMFRPDPDARPRWHGNLKQYRLGLDNSNVLRLLDAQSPGQPAISSAGTGFIAECARSYWTPSTDDTYWTNQTTANCQGHAASSNSPDGNIVEKGAQGYKLRGLPSATSISRNIKTCDASCGTTLANFDTSNSSLVTSLGSSDLVNWARGLNVDSELPTTPVLSTAMRPSAHGDVVHSRPVAINYGTDAAPKVVVFYGDNGGPLKAINGNRDNYTGHYLADGADPNINSVAPGGELWSFVAPDFYSKFSALRSNTDQIAFKGMTGIPKPYGFDGPIVAHKSGSNTWLFAAQRRGGRMVYAFDVTNIHTGTAPSLKWRFGCPAGATCTGTSGADVASIGQTWSVPKIFKAAGYGSGASPMLIMGGGYDTCEDADPHTCTTSSTGRHIYVLDANTGAHLKTFTTDRPVVGDVFVIPGSSNMAMWIYAADMGGNLYRISGATANAAIGTTVPNDWTITKIAALGCNTPSTCTTPRKFMYGPDIVDNLDGTYSLMLGSGDREKPVTAYTSAYGVTNYFFMVKDNPTSGTWLSSENTDCGADVMCLASLVAIPTNADPDPLALVAAKGWYLPLNAHEQVVTSAITVYSVITFSTHTPAEATTVDDPDTEDVDERCISNLGTARVYNVQLSNAGIANGTTSRFEEIVGGGLPPSPVAGMVTLDNGVTVPFLIGGSPTSPLEGGTPTTPPSASRPKGRVYWYIEQ